MSYVTIQKSEDNTNNLSLTSVKLRKPNLIAQWSMVDGKLVCKWLVQDTLR